MSSFCKRNGERLLGDIWRKEEVFNTFKLNSNFGTIRPTSLTYRHTDTNIWNCFIDIVMKRIYLFNIVAWNYRKKIGFPVCKKENFAGLQAHRKRGKSARASPTPHHTLNEERSARFTAQPLSALVWTFKSHLISDYSNYCSSSSSLACSAGVFS